MSAYAPAFETQRDENAPKPWTNCNPASAAMLVDQWTYGRSRTTDVALRRASPVPLDRGMNFAQVAAALKKVLPQLGDLRYSEADGSGNANQTWDSLRAHLANGGGAVVCGTYSSLAGRTAASGLALDRWQPGGSFGHATFACDYRPADAGGDGRVLWMDPLGHGDYSGDRIRLEDLYAFVWRQGNNDAGDRVTAAHAFSVPRPSPATFRDVPPDHRFYRDVEWMVERGLTSPAGVGGSGNYYPDRLVTRGQLAAFLHRDSVED